MADNFSISPNMGLVVPTIGVDPGPDWATNVNADLSILDGHDHSPGSGVQITPSGININTDLAFNDNNVTLVRSVRFSPQGSTLSGALDLNCVYVSGVDLYYNDGNGNKVKITSGGTVNATSSGIVSGTATAGFVANVLVVDQAVNTPANIQAGSILLGNNTAGSNFVTLSPPNPVTSSYTITLPILPASNLPMSIDNSGNITAAQISTAQIANLAVTDAKIADATITLDKLAVRATGTTVGIGGVAISPTIGGYVINSGTLTTICTLTLTTTGSPVRLSFEGDGAASGSDAQAASTGSVMTIAFFNGSTQQSTYQFEMAAGRDVLNPSCQTLDTPVAGTYTYTVQVSASSTTWNLSNMRFVAYEL